MEGLEGRVAVVTGGASGVGLGIATVLASEGAHVVIVDVDGAAAEQAATTLPDASAEAADVVDRAAMETLGRSVEKRLGRVDIVAANAGIYPSTGLEEMTDEDWDRVMNINVKGVLHTIQAFLPAMKRAHYGRVVLTSSITGPNVSSPGLAHYAASKAALLGLMRTAALELVGYGITVNAVQPGNVRTPGIDQFSAEFIQGMVDVIPVGRLAEPADVGWAVRFLASTEAEYITGQTIVVDGGQVVPEGPLAG